jgi:hypothetical protein
MNSKPDPMGFDISVGSCSDVKKMRTQKLMSSLLHAMTDENCFLKYTLSAHPLLNYLHLPLKLHLTNVRHLIANLDNDEILPSKNARQSMRRKRR